jgi:hypothetical protein
MSDADAFEAISLSHQPWRTNDQDSSVGVGPPRLVRVVVSLPVSAERIETLSSLVLIIHGQRPHVRTEWYVKPLGDMGRSDA